MAVQQHVAKTNMPAWLINDLDGLTITTSGTCTRT